MKKIIAVTTFGALMLFGTTSYAHITNEKTVFEDVQYSEAKEQLVLLKAIGAISTEEGANIYKPQEKLTRADLGVYAANFHELKPADYKEPTGEDVEITIPNETLDKLAVEKGFIPTSNGNATYDDVNKAYFNGKLKLADGKKELTKEEFAFFLDYYWNELLERTTYKEGPTGKITDVKVNGEEVTFTVNGKEYKFFEHGKVINGPTDLSLWKGKTIGESLLNDGQILVAKVDGKFPTVPTVQVSKIEKVVKKDEPTKVEKDTKSQENKEMTKEKQEKSLPIVPIAGGVVLIVIIGLFFFKKK